MEKRNSKHSAIFFHMGPGLHSRNEAQVFSQQFDHVAFLDQPQGLGFQELVDWTCQVVKEQYTASQKPLILLGHSFGAQLIAAALPKVGSMVAEVRLVNSTFDPFDCFANLERTLSPAEAKGCAYWKTKSAEDKLHLIYFLAQHEAMAAAYWFNKENQTAYNVISQQHPPLNIGTFAKVFTEFLNEQPHLKNPVWSGPTQIYYSKADNLILESSIVEEWRKTFPQARFIEVKDVGHYGLFESAELARSFFGIHHL